MSTPVSTPAVFTRTRPTTTRSFVSGSHRTCTGQVVHVSHMDYTLQHDAEATPGCVAFVTVAGRRDFCY